MTPIILSMCIGFIGIIVLMQVILYVLNRIADTMNRIMACLRSMSNHPEIPDSSFHVEPHAVRFTKNSADWLKKQKGGQ